MLGQPQELRIELQGQKQNQLCSSCLKHSAISWLFTFNMYFCRYLYTLMNKECLYELYVCLYVLLVQKNQTSYH